jgi:hypothetical protein
MDDDLKFPDQDAELQDRAGGAVEPGEALRRKSTVGRVLRKGSMDKLPEAMKPQPMDNAPVLPPVSPAAQGNPMPTSAEAREGAPLPQRSKVGGSSFTITIDNRVQGKTATPILIKDGAKAFIAALPATELGIRLESGRQYLVTITETANSVPKLRRLGGSELHV